MQEIHITITEKIAEISGAPAIIRRNGDYTIRFSFDEEWSPYPIKTARFVYVQDGIRRYRDVLFSGSSVTVPILHNTDAVEVGVYAGNIHTSTPVQIPCDPSIADGADVHQPPAPDVYEQLLEHLESMPVQNETCTGTALPHLIGTDSGETGIVLEVSAAEPDTLAKTDMMQYAWEQGSGNDNTGEMNAGNATRIRCHAYIGIPDGAVVMLVQPRSTSDEQFLSCLYFYDAENRYMKYEAWVAFGGMIGLPAGAKTVRVILRKANSTVITPDELASCDVAFL